MSPGVPGMRYREGVKRVLRLRSLSVVALAWAGATLGHVVGYLLAHPDAAARHARLAATGHGSFGLLAAAAAAAGVGALAVLALRRDGRMGSGSLVLRLVPLQTAILCAGEVVERGMDPGAAFRDPAVLLALAVQAVVAGAAALLVRAAHLAVDAVRARRRLPLRAPGRLPRPALVPLPAVAAPRSSSGRRRAPPLPLAA